MVRKVATTTIAATAAMAADAFVATRHMVPISIILLGEYEEE